MHDERDQSRCGGIGLRLLYPSIPYLGVAVWDACNLCEMRCPVPFRMEIHNKLVARIANAPLREHVHRAVSSVAGEEFLPEGVFPAQQHVAEAPAVNACGWLAACKGDKRWGQVHQRD